MGQPGERHNGDIRQPTRGARAASRRRLHRLLAFGAAVALLAGLAAISAALWSRTRPTRPMRASVSTNAAGPSAPASVSTNDAGPSSEPSASPAPMPPKPKLQAFNVGWAERYLMVLSARIGVRAAGSHAEKISADYIRAQLEAMGYSPKIEPFKLGNGKRSQNVTAILHGATDRRFILGAHYDTKRPSPGANDNGTGSVALMAIAKELADERLPYTIDFVWFGAEETIDSNRDHHHYGSRYHATSLGRSRRALVDGMLSIDMIGYGPEFLVRTMNTGPQGLRTQLLTYAKRKGLPATYRRDPSPYGYSDHEPFERLGLPVAWIEWHDDPTYHSKEDTIAHLQWDKVRAAGQVVLDFMRSLDAADLASLHASR